jgi:two-component system, OmpR family, sensor kinase
VSSLRRTLVLTLLLAVVAVTLVTGLGTYRQAREGLDSVFDYHLRQLALALRDQAWGRAGELGAASEEFDFVIQVWDANGERRYLSRPGTGLPEVATLGFATVPTASGLFRVYSVALSDLVVQVAQPPQVRDRLAFEAASRTLWPSLVLIPIFALLVWVVVGRGLRPLNRLARAAAARTPTALAPFEEAGLPVELAPLVASLNGLLGQLRAALQAQRDFVADAAHELRTPLAALSLQVQLARRAGDDAERASALGEVAAGLERATRVVRQLLTLAHEEDPRPLEPATAPVSLAELVGQAVADHALLAEERGLDLGAAGLEGRRPFLEVADSGPGIPAQERERVFDRFYRRRVTAEPGTGLGLAIVKAVADRHHAEVSLGDRPGGGLTVRVTFSP